MISHFLSQLRKVVVAGTHGLNVGTNSTVSSAQGEHGFARIHGHGHQAAVVFEQGQSVRV